jgi:hypothetical protein
MRCTMKSLVLATLAIGQTYAATVGNVHSALHSHARKHNHGQIEKRANALTAADSSKLTALGAMIAGVNAATSAGGIWLGEDGAYKNEITNESGEDIIVVCWGVAASWINAVQPHITASLPAGQSIWISASAGQTGACSSIHSDTELVNGQVKNTWFEFTFGEYGVIDVSREVDMQGHSISVVGPTCTTDMNTCVFKCGNGELVCTFNYVLENCANGSQPGANYGTYDGAPSGGCGGMGSSATLKTTIS